MNSWGIFFISILLFFSCSAPKRNETVSNISTSFGVSKSSIYTLSTKGDTLSSVSLGKSHERIVLLATPFYSFIEKLDQQQRVKGVYSLDRLIDLPSHIQNVSAGGGVDLEKIIQLQPDLIICNSYQEQDLKQVMKNCDILIIDEFLEHNPLQKASWVLLFGELLDQPGAAKKVFQEIKSSYKTFPAMKAKVLQLNNFDSWFQPGCGNYISQLVRDAGAEMVCVPNEDGSVTVSEEQAIVLLNDMDYLLFFDWDSNPETLKSRLNKVLEVRKGKSFEVIYCNTQNTQFYQKSILNPGSVLRDINRVLSSQEDGEFFKIITLE